MSAEVESRRFRTWEQEAQGNVVRSWWLIVRYLVNRYAKTWYVYMVIILGIFGAMLGLFLQSLLAGEAGDIPFGARPDIIQEGPMAFIGIGMVLFALLVTAPSIAEDLRFNAQLFYFSKPLRIRDYMLGKNMFNFLGMAIVGLIPVLILSASVLATGPGDEAGIREALRAQGVDAAEIQQVIDGWRLTGVDTWGDAFYLAFMPVAAVLSLSVGLVGITMAVSSFTRRAWHAAVGTAVLVTGWSVLGGVMADAVNDSTRMLYSPMGWVEAITFLPLESRFPWMDCRVERSFPWYCEGIEHAGSTIFWAHMLLIITGTLGIIVAWMRMKRLEGAA